MRVLHHASIYNQYRIYSLRVIARNSRGALALSLPKKIVKKYGLKRGDTVHIIILGIDRR